MVAKVRTTADNLTHLQELQEKPYSYDFFSVLRYLECLYPDKPRLGEAARPMDEPVRLSQEPSLAFAPSSLASFEAGDQNDPHRLAVFFFGVFGPNGPLPLHLTEYAREREYNDDDPTFRRFVDIFHHRLLLLFYRAWANANPATSLDRPSPRPFDRYVGSLFGLGSEDARSRDALPDEAKLYLSGFLGMRTRPAKGLLAILGEFLEVPVRLNQFAGEWMALAPDDRCRLGAGSIGSRLGLDMALGGSVWSCQHKFRVICGPLKLEQFKRLLPGRESLSKLRDLVRIYLGDEFAWDLNLLLVSADVPSTRLGMSGELGWTTWLGERRTEADADDVVVYPAVPVG